MRNRLSPGCTRPTDDTQRSTEMEAFMRKSPTTARLQPKSPATPAAAAEKETKDEKVARGALSDGRQEEISSVNPTAS